MPTATTDWRDIQDDREKYQAYLCSREWAEKREAVKERAGGKCERCTVLPIDAVHHLTYKRKYAERLEDLSAICTPCHEFTHGKSDFDPKHVSTRLTLNYLLRSREQGKQAVPPEVFVNGVSVLSSRYRYICVAIESLMFLSETLYATRQIEDVFVISDQCTDKLDELLPFNYAHFYRVVKGHHPPHWRIYDWALKLLGMDKFDDEIIDEDSDA